MVKPRTDDCSQLEAPLLSDRSGNFSFRPAQVTLDVDTCNGETIHPDPNPGVAPEAALESQRSGYFASLSERWNSSLSGHEDAAAKDEEKEKTRRAQSKRRLRNPIQTKSFVRRAAHSATHEPAYFVRNLVYGIVLWPKWAWDAIQSQKSLTVLSLKSGIAAGLASVISVLSLPVPYSGISAIAVWAVVTIDLLSEPNIGLSLSKGVNRVAGTFSAGFLAVVLTQLGPDVPAVVYPYYVVFWVTFGGFVFRFLKGIPPLKEQWGYAFTVATIAFHILLISDFQQPEKVTLPLLRFSMIVFGFCLSSVVNLAVQPVYAGDTLHKLVAKNFDTAADVLSRCVSEYCKFRMLDHVPDILSGRSEDDKIHQSYHEIVMSDSDVDKLLNAVTWEPCHGPFFRGYPWHLYDDITDYLRYTLYDVIALDSCLRASIQAPKHLRDIFSQEMEIIAAECSNVLHTLADSMRNMRKFSPGDILCRAEEAALALQNKIYIHTHLLLGRGAMESPRYPLYVASSQGNVDPWSVAGTAATGDFYPDEYDSKVNQNELPQNNSVDQYGQSYGSEKDSSKSSDKNFRAVENELSGRLRDHSAPMPIPTQHGLDHPGDSIGRSVVQSSGSKEIEPTLSLSPEQGLSESSESLSRHQQNQNFREINDDGRHVTVVEEKITHNLSDHSLRTDTVGLFDQAEFNISALGKLRGPSATGWKQNFMQRRSSLGHNWEGTLERISALSLVKFASLLIEVVAKVQFVVSSVDELSQAAKFQEVNSYENLVSGN